MSIRTKRVSNPTGSTNPFSGVKGGAGVKPKNQPPPPKPKGPGISIAEVVSGAVLGAKQLAEKAISAEKARQARERERMQKFAQGAQDVFEKVAFTRVAFDPRTDVRLTPPKVETHANDQGWGVNVKFPRFTVKDLPNFIFTPPQD